MEESRLGSLLALGRSGAGSLDGSVGCGRYVGLADFGDLLGRLAHAVIGRVGGGDRRFYGGDGDIGPGRRVFGGLVERGSDIPVDFRNLALNDLRQFFLGLGRDLVGTARIGDGFLDGGLGQRALHGDKLLYVLDGE